MRVALDVDDVLANWYKAACEFCGVEYKPRDHWGKESQEFVLPAWESIKEDGDFWTNLEKLNHVDFEFDCYITSLPPHLLENRKTWLKTHGFPDKPVFVGQDKVKIAEENNIDVLIDDKPDNINKFIKSGRLAIHYMPPYTTIEPVSPHFGYDFKEIKKVLKQLKKEHYERRVKGVQSVQTRK